MSSNRLIGLRTVVVTTVLLALSATSAVGQTVGGDGEGLWLSSPRTGHTATLLTDGRVLVAGGSDGETDLASLEIIDHIAASRVGVGTMATARTGHTATLLADGRVLLAGGMAAGASLADAELLDPLTGTSELVGPMGWARADHAATVLPDGNVLLLGGFDRDKPVAGAEIFDVAASTFRKITKPKSAHLGPAVAVLPDGSVLVTGIATKKKVKPAERYDPAKDKWTPLKGAVKRKGHTSTLLDDGRVLQAGGAGGSGSIAEARLFDASSGGFAPAAAMAAPRSDHTATLLPDGRVLILGGADAGFGIAEVEVFDPASSSFAIAGEVDLPPIGHTATLLPDGNVLLVGGQFVDLVLEDVLVYDPSTATLQPLGAVESGSTTAAALSPDGRTRADIRGQHGPPDAFAIFYFDEPLPDGSTAAASMSQWSYYNEGVEYTFADEGLVAEDAIELRGEARAEPVPYDPDQFSAYMSLDDVVAAAGIDEYVGGPVDEMVEGGDLFFADRLTWGIKDGELRYIEALALEAEDLSREVE